MSSLTLPKPTAVIFDWDNTLVDTWPIIHAALVATFEAMGQKAWSFEDTKRKVRKSMRDSFPEFFGDDWQRAADVYQVEYRKHHLTNLTPLPGSLEVIQRVRELGLFSTIVSNKKGGNLRTEVAHLGWDKYFDRIIGADDAARDKPFREPVELAFKDSGHAPGAHVWFIGDSDIDLHCAQNTGCTPILYGLTPPTHDGYTTTHYLGFPYSAHPLSHQALMQLL